MTRYAIFKGNYERIQYYTDDLETTMKNAADDRPRLTLVACSTRDGDELRHIGLETPVLVYGMKQWWWLRIRRPRVVPCTYCKLQ